MRKRERERESERASRGGGRNCAAVTNVCHFRFRPLLHTYCKLLWNAVDSRHSDGQGFRQISEATQTQAQTNQKLAEVADVLSIGCTYPSSLFP